MKYFPNIIYIKNLGPLTYGDNSSSGRYQKSLFLNRTVVSGANGLIRLTIPIKKGRNQTDPLAEVQVAFDENWRKDHWKALVSSYNKSPWFEHYYDIMAEYFRKDFALLLEWNVESLNIVRQMLGMTVETLSLEKGEVGIPPALFTHPSGEVVIRPGDLKPYPQVFADRFGFIPDLSVLDLIFCVGPREAKDYLMGS